MENLRIGVLGEDGEAMDMHGRAANASRGGIFAAPALIILQSSMQQLGWKRRRSEVLRALGWCEMQLIKSKSKSVFKQN